MKPLCKNCEQLKEKGMCPAICPGSMKELKKGVQLMREMREERRRSRR